MSATNVHWTAAKVRELPDDRNRYEVVDGALLVTPAPTWEHQAACRKLFLRLHAYVAEHRLGEAILAPADVEFSPDRMVEPDVFVVPLVRGRAPRTWEEVGRLLLAVEVISPSSARADRLVKRRLYQREGVPEYWIVDVASRTVERWRPNDARPEVLDERLLWQPDATMPTLEIDLKAYFTDLLGE